VEAVAIAMNSNRRQLLWRRVLGFLTTVCSAVHEGSVMA
jgi:hypothetical protein